MNITESRDYNIALTMSRMHANITQLTKKIRKNVTQSQEK